MSIEETEVNESVEVTDGRTDEQVLKDFINLLENKVSINTGFVPDQNGILTHQVLEISCGEYKMVSQPEPLSVPLIPAPLSQTGVTIN